MIVKGVIMYSETIYEPIVKLAVNIGQIQKSYYRKKNIKMETKSSEVDMVTEVDLMCDDKIVTEISRLFPDDKILSEEQGHTKREGLYEWIIDPLDGTTNFSKGHPIFAVSIARWKDNEPVFGVVYVPMLDELYIAEKGKGAYFNGEKITCSAETTLKQSLIATGFPYDRATSINNNSRNFEKMVPHVKGLRRLGAAAYDLCLVAAGIYDAYWELRLSKWDMAAGMLMITEAGGTFDYTVENEKYNVVAGAPIICESIKAIVSMDNHQK